MMRIGLQEILPRTPIARVPNLAVGRGPFHARPVHSGPPATTVFGAHGLSGSRKDADLDLRERLIGSLRAFIAAA